MSAEVAREIFGAALERAEAVSGGWDIAVRSFSYAQLLRLAEAMGTQNIRIAGEIEFGCPTCDGDSAITVLEVRL